MLKELAAVGDGDLEVGLRKVAANLVREAVAGDQNAIESLANRIDGRPAQQVNLANEDGGPLSITIKRFTEPGA